MSAEIFITEKTFQEEIENLVYQKNMTHMEAVLHYCSQNNIDPEDVKKLISSNLKAKIKINAMDEGLMKKESILPI